MRRVRECLEAMETELRCSVCMELSEDLRLLPCTHRFCSECLQRLDCCALCAAPFRPRDVLPDRQLSALAAHVRDALLCCQQAAERRQSLNVASLNNNNNSNNNNNVQHDAVDDDEEQQLLSPYKRPRTASQQRLEDLRVRHSLPAQLASPAPSPAARALVASTPVSVVRPASAIATPKSVLARSAVASPSPDRSFVCHTGLTENEVEDLNEVVQSLNLSVRDAFTSNIGFVVCGTDHNGYGRRTLKFMCGVAAGVCVLRREWLMARNKTDFASFLCRGCRIDDKIISGGPERAAVAGKPFLQGIRAAVVHVNGDPVKAVLMAAGCKVVKSGAELVITDDAEVDDEDTWRKHEGADWVSPNWLFDAATAYDASLNKEPYAVHCTFENHTILPTQQEGVFSIEISPVENLIAAQPPPQPQQTKAPEPLVPKESLNDAAYDVAAHDRPQMHYLSSHALLGLKPKPSSPLKPVAKEVAAVSVQPARNLVSGANSTASNKNENKDEESSFVISSGE